MPSSLGSQIHASSEDQEPMRFFHTVSEARRLLPSASRWNSIEIDFNLIPQSAMAYDSLPSSYSKSYDRSIEYLMKSWGISTHVFNVTSKVLDEDQSIRYEQGTMEFGIPSPMFVPLTMAAFLNLAAFTWGHVEVFRGSNDLEGLFLHMFIAGFGIVNCIPIYEAIISRTDKGRIPRKTTLVSLLLAFALYLVAYVTLRS